MMSAVETLLVWKWAILFGTPVALYIILKVEKKYEERDLEVV